MVNIFVHKDVYIFVHAKRLIARTFCAGGLSPGQLCWTKMFIDGLGAYLCVKTGKYRFQKLK